MRDETAEILYPPFVTHYLLAKSRELSFDVVLNLLKELLKLSKDTLRSSRGTTWGGKTGMSILVESFPSGSQGNEAVSYYCIIIIIIIIIIIGGFTVYTDA